MKPYMLILGSSQNVETFESKVADALEMGYILAGDLITQPHATEIKFYQPVMLAEEDLEDEDEEDEEDEDEEEEDEELE